MAAAELPAATIGVVGSGAFALIAISSFMRCWSKCAEVLLMVMAAAAVAAAAAAHALAAEAAALASGSGARSTATTLPTGQALRTTGSLEGGLIT